jgi:hypothetical protein
MAAMRSLQFSYLSRTNISAAPHYVELCGVTEHSKTQHYITGLATYRNKLLILIKNGSNWG